MNPRIPLPRIASIALSALALLGATPHHGNAAELQVPMEFPTIQAAINAAADGDEIRVAPGIYTQSLNFNQKNVSLTSTDGAATTIIMVPAVTNVRIGRQVRSPALPSAR
jgi:pectin methylesterase-like acyl-CoA thioesterase